MLVAILLETLHRSLASTCMYVYFEIHVRIPFPPLFFARPNYITRQRPSPTANGSDDTLGFMVQVSVLEACSDLSMAGLQRLTRVTLRLCYAPLSMITLSDGPNHFFRSSLCDGDSSADEAWVRDPLAIGRVHTSHWMLVRFADSRSPVSWRAHDFAHRLPGARHKQFQKLLKIYSQKKYSEKF